MSEQKLLALGWKQYFRQQVPASMSDAVIVRVSAHFGSQVLVAGEQGELRVPVQLAEAAGDLAVGDWLLLNPDDHRAMLRLDRQTLLLRKAAGEEVKPQLIAANVDTIFVVSSCNQDFNLSRIERYLALTLQSQAQPVVVLTKADLREQIDDLRQQVAKLHPGLLVECLDARDPAQVKDLLPWCRAGQSIALLGSSGVGKSTLANTLGANAGATGEIREQDGKGRHVTTARSLHVLPSGGVLVDNPGMRELQLADCEAGVNDLFDDVVQIATRCRFQNCQHEGDAGCAVQEAVESGEIDERRLASFKKLLAEQAHNARSLAERRDRDRKTGKFYKSVIAGKRRRREGE